MNSPKREKKENIWLNLLLNIVIPTIILTKFSGENELGPKLAVVIALAFPITYGLLDFRKTSKVNFFSALGVISVALTGGMTLLALPAEYIAIKEAAIPGLIGLGIIGSTLTPYPVVKMLVYSEAIFDVKRIEDAVAANNHDQAFQRSLFMTSVILSASFFLSSVLNYGLAKYILVSPPGTEEFTAELGHLTALSYPVIVIPSMIVMMFSLYYLFRSIKRLTQLSFEDIFVVAEEEPETKAPKESE